MLPSVLGICLTDEFQWDSGTHHLPGPATHVGGLEREGAGAGAKSHGGPGFP